MMVRWVDRVAGGLAFALAILSLLYLAFGCAFQGGGYGIEAKWTIADGQVGCQNEDGYPSGENCVASGAEAVQAISEASTYADEDAEASEDDE